MAPTLNYWGRPYVPVFALTGRRREKTWGWGGLVQFFFTFQCLRKIARRVDKWVEIRTDLHGNDLSPLAPLTDMSSRGSCLGPDISIHIVDK